MSVNTDNVMPDDYWVEREGHYRKLCSGYAPDKLLVGQHSYMGDTRPQVDGSHGLCPGCKAIYEKVTGNPFPVADPRPSEPTPEEIGKRMEKEYFEAGGPEQDRELGPNAFKCINFSEDDDNE